MNTIRPLHTPYAPHVQRGLVHGRLRRTGHYTVAMAIAWRLLIHVGASLSLSLPPAGYCSPRRGVPFNHYYSTVRSALDGACAAGWCLPGIARRGMGCRFTQQTRDHNASDGMTGPGGCCSPGCKVPLQLRDEGYHKVRWMTSQGMSARLCGKGLIDYATNQLSDVNTKGEGHSDIEWQGITLVHFLAHWLN